MKFKVNTEQFKLFLKIQKDINEESSKWKINKNEIKTVVNGDGNNIVGLMAQSIVDFEGDDMVIGIFGMKILYNIVNLSNDELLNVEITEHEIKFTSSEWTTSKTLGELKYLPQIISLSPKMASDFNADSKINVVVSSDILKKLNKAYSALDKPDVIKFSFSTDGSAVIGLQKDENGSSSVKFTTKSDSSNIDSFNYKTESFISIINSVKVDDVSIVLSPATNLMQINTKDYTFYINAI